MGSMRLLEAAGFSALPLLSGVPSEMFGALAAPQNELTHWRSTSAVTAWRRCLFLYWAIRNYREACWIVAVNGILFITNHRGAVRRSHPKYRGRGASRPVSSPRPYMGNLDAVRGLGYAPECRRHVVMPQTDEPGRFVATGRGFTVREFARAAPEHAAGLDWQQQYAKFDQRYLRPTEVDSLIGDATKAALIAGLEGLRTLTSWARIMVDGMAALECEGEAVDKPMTPAGHERVTSVGPLDRAARVYRRASRPGRVRALR